MVKLGRNHAFVRVKHGKNGETNWAKINLCKRSSNIVWNTCTITLI